MAGPPPRVEVEVELGMVGEPPFGDRGVVTLLREGPKVVKAETVLLGELAQIGPSVCWVSMTIGVVKGV